MRAPARLTRIVLLLALIAGSADLALAASSRGVVYYLALGDSLSVGAQPGPTGQNVPTNRGYTDDLHAILQKSTRNLQLVKLGCIGETTSTMILGGSCLYPSGSQLDEAVAFLKAHAGSVVLVTIDLGANDLLPCVAGVEIDLTCISTAFSDIASNLPYILSVLRTAVGGTPIAAMNYYDPFLAAWLQGPAGRELAVESVQLLEVFNDLLGFVYEKFGVRVGDVAAAFRSSDFDPVVSVPRLGTVPPNVVVVCLLTWMCAPPPHGPNIHANAFGYGVIAGAIFAVLPRR